MDLNQTKIGASMKASIPSVPLQVALLDINKGLGSSTSRDFNSKYGADRTVFLQCDVRNENQVAGSVALKCAESVRPQLAPLPFLRKNCSCGRLNATVVSLE